MVDSLPSLISSNGWPAGMQANDTVDLVDRQLERFLPIIQRAIAKKSTVIAVQLWQRTPAIALLPFHLHLRWLERVESLPLNARFGFVPFFKSDGALVSGSTFSYSISEASAARERARRNRGQAGTQQITDFTIPDWEQGYQRHSAELRDLNLPGSSFVAVDVALADGGTNRGNRPVLGRRAIRGAHRPLLLVPSRAEVSQLSAQLFAGVEVLLVNLQGVRGRNALHTIRMILAARQVNNPTVIIASSPSDLLALDLPDLLQSAEIACLGDEPVFTDVRTVSVSSNRYLDDRSFDFAVNDLRGRSDRMDYLVDLARRAWWASQQSLGQSELDPDVKRFERALEGMVSNIEGDLGLFSMAKDLISKANADGQRATARCLAVTEAAINTGGKAGILIIARGSSTRALRDEMSSIIGLPPEALGELGVRVESPFSYSAIEAASPDVIIVAGYFGLATIDKILTSRARTARLVFDPIEARSAWWGIAKLIRFMKDHGLTKGVTALRSLADAIAEAIPPQLRSVASDVDIATTWFDFTTGARNSIDVTRSYVENSSDVIVFLTDGTRLDVSENARFDLLGTMGTHLKTVAAKQLNPGDEIILLNEDSRGLFSEQLIAGLDNGVLKGAAEERQRWLMLVRVQVASSKVGPATIAARLAEDGDNVAPATVRSWIVDDGGEASVPNSRERFLKFATALEIELPRERLDKLFDGIKRVRIGHRVAGRKLGRTIRAAYLNRLDAGAVSRIQKEWGLGIVELIKSARVAVVDDVVLPREM